MSLASLATAFLAVASTAVFAVSLFALYIMKYKRLDTRKAIKDANAIPGGVLGEDESDVDDGKQHCTILFGTQTGTAEKFAKSLRSQLASAFGTHASFDVLDMENYDAAEQLPKEKLVFFVLATYGDGEPTDNAQKFYEWLLQAAKAGESEDLLTVRLLLGCAWVGGLGDRGYFHHLLQVVAPLSGSLRPSSLAMLLSPVQMCAGCELRRVWPGQPPIRALLCGWQACAQGDGASGRDRGGAWRRGR
jgi:hypothetical protein